MEVLQIVLEVYGFVTKQQVNLSNRAKSPSHPLSTKLLTINFLNSGYVDLKL